MTDDRDIAYPAAAEGLTREYVVWVRSRLRTGWLSDEAAVAALRSRDPNVTADAVRKLLEEEG